MTKRRRPTLTFPPPRKRPAKATFVPTTPVGWEARALLLQQERDRLRVVLRDLVEHVKGSSSPDAVERALAELGEST